MDELLIDERFVAVHVKGKGLVVFSACSHAGIVNVLHEANTAFPGIPLHAVFGGFHLSGTNERIIPETVRDMRQFRPNYIIPAHCTGWRAVNALAREFGESVVLPCSVGKRFCL
jgi:7,8-dihydropterin-6-yl-methyl-4-(beta-D-ribofuranosyl)aminobenzene 5'-phosphate synthase